ncbi:MAG: hypothetical protein ACOYYJ_09290, partial [Chloroflexota bacterium]
MLISTSFVEIVNVAWIIEQIFYSVKWNLSVQLRETGVIRSITFPPTGKQYYLQSLVAVFLLVYTFIGSPKTASVRSIANPISPTTPRKPSPYAANTRRYCKNLEFSPLKHSLSPGLSPGQAGGLTRLP